MSQVKATDVLRGIFDRLDKQAAEVVANPPEGLKISCTKGCAHCCYQLVTVTFVEALLIAEKVFEKPDWRSLLSRLAESAKHTVGRNIDQRAYFRRKYPCVFLTSENTCGAYDVRPSACRYHYVASPPEHCSPAKENENKQTAKLDLTTFEDVVFQFSLECQRQNGKGPLPIVGPLPLAVLWAMTSACRDTKDLALIEKHLEGLPTLEQWGDRRGRLLGGHHALARARVP